VAEGLPIAGDGDFGVLEIEGAAAAPGEGAFAIDADGVDDGAEAEIVIAADFEVVDGFGGAVIGGDFGIFLEFRFAGSELQDRARFDVEHGPVLAGFLHVYAGAEDEAVSGLGAIEDSLCVVAGADLVGGCAGCGQ
jgi:hypothetical protein